ncbi:hypothetical protein ScPMuIL_014802 [Solemya velum]
MKFQDIAYIVGALLLTQTLAVPLGTEEQLTLEDLRSEITQIYQSFPGNLDGQVCSLCVGLSTEGLEQLLNIILNFGIIRSCGEVCEALADKTGSQILGVACNFACDFVGVKYFVEAARKADLDPIYYCELMDLCPINDKGDAKFTNLVVTPPSGPQGLFNIDIGYSSVNGTGTGQLDVFIYTVDGVPIGHSFLLEAQEPGSYDGNIQLNAVPDPNCDPVAEICERWLPGQYTVETTICNGECGSKHPHSQIYDTANTTFEITATSPSVARAVVLDGADWDDEYSLDDLEPSSINAYIDDEALDLFPSSNDADDDFYSNWPLDYDESDDVQSAIVDTDVDDSSVYSSWLYNNAGEDQYYMEEDDFDIELNEEERDEAHGDSIGDLVEVLDIIRRIVQIFQSELPYLLKDGESGHQMFGYDEANINPNYQIE